MSTVLTQEEIPEEGGQKNGSNNLGSNNLDYLQQGNDTNHAITGKHQNQHLNLYLSIKVVLPCHDNYLFL